MAFFFGWISFQSLDRYVYWDCILWSVFNAIFSVLLLSLFFNFQNKFTFCSDYQSALLPNIVVLFFLFFSSFNIKLLRDLHWVTVFIYVSVGGFCFLTSCFICQLLHPNIFFFKIGVNISSRKHSHIHTHCLLLLLVLQYCLFISLLLFKFVILFFLIIHKLSHMQVTLYSIRLRPRQVLSRQLYTSESDVSGGQRDT